MILLVLIALSSLALILYVFVNFLNHIEPAQIDLDRLRQKNLYLLHILQIVESPDYKLLSRNNKKYRDYLFVNYARNLKQDINELVALRPGARARLYYILFTIFYGLLILKNKIYSNVHDLRVLAGVELILVKNVAEPDPTP